MTLLYTIRQKNDMPEKDHPSPDTSPTGEPSIVHLPLEQVLPDGAMLALHRDLGFVAILTCDEQHPQMKAAQFFPPFPRIAQRGC